MSYTKIGGVEPPSLSSVNISLIFLCMSMYRISLDKDKRGIFAAKRVHYKSAWVWKNVDISFLLVALVQPSKHLFISTLSSTHLLFVLKCVV